MQESRRGLSFVLAGTLSLAASWAHAGSVDPRAKCQSAKLKAASREIVGKTRCEAITRVTGMPVDACFTKAAGKADRTYVKAGPACAGDADALHGAVDVCVARLVTDVPGSGKCPAASAKAVGKGGGAQVKCRAIDISKPGSFAACDSKEDASTAKALTRAGVCGQAPLETIAADIDACDHELHDVVEPPGGVECGGGLRCNTPVRCDVGEECSANQFHDCICGPAPSCGMSEYPTCGGVCPDGLTCVPQFVDSIFLNLSLCACVPPDHTCRESARTCGYGACPPGSVCRVSSSLGGCSAGCGGP